MTTEEIISTTIPNVASVDDVEVLGTEEGGEVAHCTPSSRIESAAGENPPTIETEADAALQHQPSARGTTAPTNILPPQTRYPQHEGSFSISYKAYLRAMSCALVNMLPFPWRARQPRCVLLGRRYDFSDSEDHEAFKSDFTSRILFTYRHGFSPLTPSSPRLLHKGPSQSPSSADQSIATASTMNRKISSFFRQRMSYRGERGLTSDSGWGCMIRVFQMAMAQVLMQLHFGRDWRRPQCDNAITIGRKQVLLNRCSRRMRRSYSFDGEWSPSREPGNPTPEEILALLNPASDKPLCNLSADHPNSNSMPLLLKNNNNNNESLTAYEQQEPRQETNEWDCHHRLMQVYPWNLLPILSLFRDVPAARFSLHRIVAVGRIGLGIKAGAWFGPTSCSDSMAVLITGSMNLTDLPGNTIDNQQPLTVYPNYMAGGVRVSVYHSKHGEISRNRVQRLFRHSTDTPVCTAAAPSLASEFWHLTGSGSMTFSRQPRRLLRHPCERATSLPPCVDRLRRRACSAAAGSRKASTVNGSLMVDVGHDGLDLPSKRRLQSDAVIIFLSFRLGLDSFNLRYQPFLQSCFGMPQFQGLAGGGPLTSAYWFVAANDEHLYFLDPHSPVQPALREIEQCVSICGSNPKRDEIYSAVSSPEAPGRPSWLKQIHSPATASEGCDRRMAALRNSYGEGWTIFPGLKINNEAYSKEAVDHMFFPSAPKQLNWRALNPSMTLVFLCQSFLAFEDLLLRLSEVDSEGLISVVEDEEYGISSDFGLHKSGVGPESRNLSFDSAEDGFYLL